MPHRDPEKKAEYMRKYQQENRERINELNRESRERTNRKEKDRERYLNDDEYRNKVLAKNREQSKKHRHKKREYLNNRRKEQRQKMIEHLGGKCLGCGSTKDLQFDHIDRKEKVENVSKLLGHSDERVLLEVNKCQLLCSECHNIKTRANYDYEKLLKGYSLKSIVNTGGEITITYQISNETQ